MARKTAKKKVKKTDAEKAEAMIARANEVMLARRFGVACSSIDGVCMRDFNSDMDLSERTEDWEGQAEQIMQFIEHAQSGDTYSTKRKVIICRRV
jgi:hypothetical protein